MNFFSWLLYLVTMPSSVCVSGVCVCVKNFFLWFYILGLLCLFSAPVLGSSMSLRNPCFFLSANSRRSQYQDAGSPCFTGFCCFWTLFLDRSIEVYLPASNSCPLLWTSVASFSSLWVRPAASDSEAPGSHCPSFCIVQPSGHVEQCRDCSLMFPERQPYQPEHNASEDFISPFA